MVAATQLNQKVHQRLTERRTREMTKREKVKEGETRVRTGREGDRMNEPFV